MYTSIFYISATFSEVICSDCINEHEKCELINPDEISQHIHWEGEPHHCDNCGAVIESEYGVPESC